MLPSTYVAVILLAFLSGATTLIGVLLALWFKKSVKAIVIGIGFSAGIMLAISFFELVPEAVFATGKVSAVFALILGFVFLLIMHLLVPHMHFIEEKGKKAKLVRIGLLVAFGMILHDFPEGFAMANSYVYSPALGIFVALAIAIHNIPEEFAISIPLVLVKKKWFLFKLATLSALAEPFGAIVGLLLVSVAPALNPAFMAFAAGAMIFVSIDELFPLAKEYKKPELFLVGIAISLVVYFGLSLIPGL